MHNRCAYNNRLAQTTYIPVRVPNYLHNGCVDSIGHPELSLPWAKPKCHSGLPGINIWHLEQYSPRRNPEETLQIVHRVDDYHPTKIRSGSIFTI